jgi:hypothetical protein
MESCIAFVFGRHASSSSSYTCSLLLSAYDVGIGLPDLLTQFHWMASCIDIFTLENELPNLTGYVRGRKYRKKAFDARQTPWSWNLTHYYRPADSYPGRKYFVQQSLSLWPCMSKSKYLLWSVPKHCVKDPLWEG